MNEMVISLSWDQLDSLTGFMDTCLTRWGVPTILRLRVQMVTEELFSALVSAPGGQSGRMRCTFPAAGTILLQYRTAEGPPSPDLDSLRSLAESSCTYGLKIEAGQDSCTILVGQR